jgi:S1-C subfamily serine protease
MGAGQSTANNFGSSSVPKSGLHVLRVTPGSPAADTNIEPFFDFIVGIEGDQATSAIDPSQLENIVESHEGRTLNLLVWSSHTQDTRGVSLHQLFISRSVLS